MSWILDDFMLGFPLPTPAPATGRPSQEKTRSTADQDQEGDALEIFDPLGWRGRIALLKDTIRAPRASFAQEPVTRRQAWYRLQLGTEARTNGLEIGLFHRAERKDGELGACRSLDLDRSDLETFDDPEDRLLLDLLLAARGESRSSLGYEHYSYPSFSHSRAVLPPPLFDAVLPRLCATGRLGSWETGEDPVQALRALRWDDGPPWCFGLRFTAVDGDDERWQLIGICRRGEIWRPLADASFISHSGLVVFDDELARLEIDASWEWIHNLRLTGEIPVPAAEVGDMLVDLYQLPTLPELELPSGWSIEQASPGFPPRLALTHNFLHRSFNAAIWFDYSGLPVSATATASGVVDHERQRILLRDRQAEGRGPTRLLELGGRVASNGELAVPQDRFVEVVETLTGDGWLVELESRKIRRSSNLKLSMTSGIDWFELDGEATFEEVPVPLTGVLTSIRAGSRLIRLDDGSEGLLPQAWLDRYTAVAQAIPYPRDGEAVRLPALRALLLDTMLDAVDHQPEADSRFAQLRERLRAFAGIEPCPEPRGFHGELRPYQRIALGWLLFLRDFGFGGCLADDMGLGKTIQVLALLQKLRLKRAATEKRPSLIVVPRSLLHNWRDEAARFTPHLRLLTYAGSPHERHALLDSELDRADVVVTTYGLLRIDILHLEKIAFEYVVLDEAQAIKNAKSQLNKACRLLEAKHRLVLTGTPVENHLGELWTLFEFLNPGMLGDLPDLQRSGETQAFEAEGLIAVTQALRPFILRRTKEEVLEDLPPKTEQVLYCELAPRQRHLYNKLRNEYRSSLRQKITLDGLGRSKIHVLEALLRLRQVACHGGLIDPFYKGQKSGKLELLLGQVKAVLDEGHKALIFSQFTSLLAIVRRRLEREQMTCEYLDGSTRDRRRVVERFQNDPDCKLFLISLKAGGVGLNLTAASYVFILDPWWNPAVEAQAIDRTHRIGQTRPIIAYKLISRDTVEEKILELQRSKRQLADAILSTDQSLIRDLTAEDLRFLLS